MVTGATYLKRHHLTTTRRLDAFVHLLLERCTDFGVSLQAWAVFSNHYHTVVVPQRPTDLPPLFSHLHSESARVLNDLDGDPGRQVWFQFWDTALTFEKSYLARLKYVHTNAVHHRLVDVPEAYPWCSAAWFSQTAGLSLVKTVNALRIDRVHVVDAYLPKLPRE